MKNMIKLTIGILVAVIMAGCSGGVDENRLAELTGDKNLEQVKQSYILSVSLEKEDDLKVYAYWLKKYSDKNIFNENLAFDAEMFKKKIDIEYKKDIAQYKNTMEKISIKLKSKNITHREMRDIEMLKDRLAFVASSSKFIKQTFIPFLKTSIIEALKIIETQKKEKYSHSHLREPLWRK